MFTSPFRPEIMPNNHFYSLAEILDGFSILDTIFRRFFQLLAERRIPSS
jgi:hypothetical protein